MGDEEFSSPADRPAKTFEFAHRVHCYLGDFVRSADQKAAFFLVVAAALLGWFNGQLFHSSAPLSDAARCVAIAGMAPTGTAAGLAVSVVWPRQHKVWQGLIAFQGILAEREYVERVAGLTSSAIVAELSCHSRALAEILRVKYTRLELAVGAFAGGGFFAIVLVVVRLFR